MSEDIEEIEDGGRKGAVGLMFVTISALVMAVAITGDASPTVAGRRETYRSSHEISDEGADYDVFPDGKRFVMVRSARAGAPLVVLTDAFGSLFGSTR